MAQPYPQKEETHEREFASYMIILGVVGFVNGYKGILHKIRRSLKIGSFKRLSRVEQTFDLTFTYYI